MSTLELSSAASARAAIFGVRMQNLLLPVCAARRGQNFHTQDFRMLKLSLPVVNYRQCRRAMMTSSILVAARLANRRASCS